MITFLCPNGHKLSSPDKLAGKAGQCPNCGARFRIPGSPAADGPPVGVLPPNPVSVDHGPPQIVFLCPSGHRLHGPQSLAGKAGQCPHCGSRFRIPPISAEEPAEMSSAATPVEAAPAPAVEEVEIPLEAIEEISEEPLDPPAAPQPVSAVGEDDLDFAALEQLVHLSHGETLDRRTAEAEVHPMAALLEQLWDKRGGEPLIELQLESGEVLVPHYYAAEQSRRGHAVIAVSQADGKHTVIMVPWEKVSRMTIRGQDELPKGFT